MKIMVDKREPIARKFSYRQNYYQQPAPAALHRWTVVPSSYAAWLTICCLERWSGDLINYVWTINPSKGINNSNILWSDMFFLVFNRQLIWAEYWYVHVFNAMYASCYGFLYLQYQNFICILSNKWAKEIRGRVDNTSASDPTAPASIFGLGGYLNLKVSWPSSGCPGKHRDITSNYATSASFNMLSKSLFCNYPNIRRYAVWLIEWTVRTDAAKETTSMVQGILLAVSIYN